MYRISKFQNIFFTLLPLLEIFTILCIIIVRLHYSSLYRPRLCQFAYLAGLYTVYCIAGLLSEHCNLFRISEGLLNYSACPHIVLILPRFSVIFYYLSLTFSWSINVLFVLLLSLFSFIFYYLSVDQSMYCLFCYFPFLALYFTIFQLINQCIVCSATFPF